MNVVTSLAYYVEQLLTLNLTFPSPTELHEISTHLNKWELKYERKYMNIHMNDRARPSATLSLSLLSHT